MIEILPWMTREFTFDLPVGVFAALLERLIECKQTSDYRHIGGELVNTVMLCGQEGGRAESKDLVGG